MLQFYVPEVESVEQVGTDSKTSQFREPTLLRFQGENARECSLCGISHSVGGNSVCKDCETCKAGANIFARQCMCDNIPVFNISNYITQNEDFLLYKYMQQWIIWRILIKPLFPSTGEGWGGGCSSLTNVQRGQAHIPHCTGQYGASTWLIYTQWEYSSPLLLIIISHDSDCVH